MSAPPRPRLHALFETLRCQNVTFRRPHSAGVRSAPFGWGRTRVRNFGRHTVLVVPLEVDQAVGPLVPATDVTAGDPTWLLRRRLRDRYDERLLGVARVTS